MSILFLKILTKINASTLLQLFEDDTICMIAKLNVVDLYVVYVLPVGR